MRAFWPVFLVQGVNMEGKTTWEEKLSSAIHGQKEADFAAGHGFELGVDVFVCSAVRLKLEHCTPAVSY